VITAATLKLHPAVLEPQTALLALESPGAAIELLATLRYQLADRIQAFELLPDRAIRFVGRHMPDIRIPITPDHPWFVLLETSGDSSGETEESLLQAIDKGQVVDAVMAKNRGEAEAMWRLRHSISEAQKRDGASLKHDISVPVGSVADFIGRATEAVIDRYPGTRPVAFGHVGDGNVHFNLSQPKDSDPVSFLAQREMLATIVYDIVDDFGGSISAEHGVGQAKKGHLRHYKSETEITLMRTLKLALDPDNLLNPGKVI
jgi:FAD/FMN-containing dehydrogenase